VRNFGERVDDERDALEVARGHRERREREAPTHPLDVEERPESRQRTLGEKPLDAVEQNALGRGENACRIAKRS